MISGVLCYRKVNPGSSCGVLIRNQEEERVETWLELQRLHMLGDGLRGPSVATSQLLNAFWRWPIVVLVIKNVESEAPISLQALVLVVVNVMKRSRSVIAASI